MRDQGLEALTARSVAQKLKCSTQPIYSVYGNMLDVKDDVYNRAVNFALSSMKEYQDERNVPALNHAIGWLYFAKNEKQLFKTVYHSGYRQYDMKDNLLGEEMFTEFLMMRHSTPQDTIADSTLAKISLKLCIYIIGIGTMINTNTLGLDIDEAKEMIIEMYEALLLKEGLTTLTYLKGGVAE